MKKVHDLLLISLVLVGIGCSDDRIFEEFKEINAAKWEAKDTLSFDFGTLNITDKKSLIALRFNESYAYSNCYVRVISYDSTMTIMENRLINIPLFDSKSGKPLGKGIGNTFTRYDTIPFAIAPNTRKFTLLQYMRTDQLEGIESVGIKILK